MFNGYHLMATLLATYKELVAKAKRMQWLFYLLEVLVVAICLWVTYLL